MAKEEMHVYDKLELIVRDKNGRVKKIVKEGKEVKVEKNG